MSAWSAIAAAGMVMAGVLALSSSAAKPYMIVLGALPWPAFFWNPAVKCRGGALGPVVLEAFLYLVQGGPYSAWNPLPSPPATSVRFFVRSASRSHGLRIF
jgi:hypothetical protein